MTDKQNQKPGKLNRFWDRLAMVVLVLVVITVIAFALRGVMAEYGTGNATITPTPDATDTPTVTIEPTTTLIATAIPGQQYNGSPIVINNYISNNGNPNIQVQAGQATPMPTAEPTYIITVEPTAEPTTIVPTPTPLPTYYPPADVNTFMQAREDSANWPWQKNAQLAPWVYSNTGSIDYQSADLLAQIKIFQDHGWTNMPGDPRWTSLYWPAGSPIKNPSYYLTDEGHMLYYFGKMNGTIAAGV